MGPNKYDTKNGKYKQLKESENKRISSIVMLLAGIFLTLLIFPVNIASLASMFTLFGDLFAWCTGITLGRIKFSDKTLEGSFAMFITCLILSVVYFKLGLVSFFAGLAGVISVTLVEATPLKDDNFIMTITGAIVMALFTYVV